MPQPRSERKNISEKRLWWELDKICSEEAGNGNSEKANALSSAMEHLESPTHEECQKMYDRGL